MADSNPFVDQATAPLRPTAGPADTPPLLLRLIPAAIQAAGAALTSPVRSSPLIAGRALLGGLAGYQAGQPTSEDILNRERTAYYQTRLTQTQQQAAQMQELAKDQDYYANHVLNDEQRAAWNATPPKDRGKFINNWIGDGIANTSVAANKAYLSKAWGVPEDSLHLNAKELQQAYIKTMERGGIGKRTLSQAEAEAFDRLSPDEQKSFLASKFKKQE